MRQRITIDIISNEAISFLHNMERLRLIRMRNSDTEWSKKHRGAMDKQLVQEINQQLEEIRNS